MVGDKVLDEVIKEYVDIIVQQKEELLINKEKILSAYKTDVRLKEKNFFDKIGLKITGKMEQYESDKKALSVDYDKRINELELKIKELDEKIEKSKNKDSLIYVLYNERPELFENPLFVKELLGEKIEYIIYDRSNDDDVYKNYVTLLQKYAVNKYGAQNVALPYSNQEEYWDYLEKLGFPVNCITYLTTINNIASEIDNPRKPDGGKYKIPHKYMFETLRKSMLCCMLKGKEVNSETIDRETLYGLLDSAAYYFTNDCVFPDSYGKTMEKLYLNKDNYLYYAGVFASDLEKVFHDGYYVNYGVDLMRNFWEAHTVDSSFMRLLTPHAYGRDSKIIVSVPKNNKKIVGTNGEFVSNVTKLGGANQRYLMPEYVTGACITENGEVKFVENPIRIEERSKYENYYDACNDSMYYDQGLEQVSASGRSK